MNTYLASFANKIVLFESNTFEQLSPKLKCKADFIYQVSLLKDRPNSFPYATVSNNLLIVSNEEESLCYDFHKLKSVWVPHKSLLTELYEYPTLAWSNLADKLVNPYFKDFLIHVHNKWFNTYEGELPAYHNIDHMRIVAVLANEFLVDASDQERIDLFIAASLHDMWHSGNTDVPDVMNVRATLRSLETDNLNTPTVASSILCTEFDASTRTFPIHPLYTANPKVSSALRDADLLMSSLDASGTWIANLNKEVPSVPNCLETARNWVKNMPLFTERAVEVVKNNFVL